MPPIFRSASLILLLLFTALPLQAGDVVDVGLIIGRDVHTMQDGEAETEARLSYLGLYWAEPLADGLLGRMSVEKLNLTLPDTEPGRSLEPAGFAVRIGLRGVWPQRTPLALYYGLRYSFIDATDQTATQKITWSLHELNGDLGLLWRITERLQLTALGYLSTVAGEERARGELTRNTDLEYVDTGGYGLNLDFATDASGHVGFRWLGGARDSASLYFARGFQF